MLVPTTEMPGATDQEVLLMYSEFLRLCDWIDNIPDSTSAIYMGLATAGLMIFAVFIISLQHWRR